LSVFLFFWFVVYFWLFFWLMFVFSFFPLILNISEEFVFTFFLVTMLQFRTNINLSNFCCFSQY
jgi:hypothetical protein